MSERRNIVILGASFSGLLSAHYTLKHILPALKAKKDARYHVYVISPSSDFYFRIASPRTGASTALLPAEKIFFDIHKAFKPYPAEDLTFIQAAATGLNITSRSVSYKRSDYLGDETLNYHALIVATGTRTHDPVYSQHTDSAATINAIKSMNAKVSSAKDIIITGGGPTGVESAGELGELLNGKPGWFSTPPRKVNITLITAANQLLPTLRPALGKKAEDKLKKLGVDVLYNTRVAAVSPSSNNRTAVTLTKGDRLEADLYIPAHGVLPNTSFLPSSLLTTSGYLKTNASTLRVDDAGARVYAIGDVSSYSRNNILDIYDALPILGINLKRDLLAYNPQYPNEKAPGKDRLYKPNTSEMMIVPIGSAGGVGVIFGWKVPNWFVWLLKSRDFMVGMGPPGVVGGGKVAKEYAWTKEEAV
ncbi:FAD/NAD(P)-binding domain-containing protein [Lindgomyces ingoldianus]|uniref:FAD/NAD(P)-binding domain-containing protein n=1 Tax=Lindgomyces ingoldianus TaxID=673940 RepID=A0ACB6RE66_9PLEO|nr:FAD/NAD(P)-binding domain-containing protein [Lindgomyces ingoldianus]KAF2477431.1 FAD/NAD(P)-binding domain-containing protein [Lindgomyces ingoldianus]